MLLPFSELRHTSREVKILFPDLLWMKKIGNEIKEVSNRPFNSCVFSNLAYNKRGWRWLSFDTDLSTFLI